MVVNNFIFFHQYPLLRHDKHFRASQSSHKKCQEKGDSLLLNEIKLLCQSYIAITFHLFEYK